MWFYNWLSNSMEEGPSWEADTRLAGQEVLRLLWTPKVHCYVHRSLLSDLILSQFYPAHTAETFSKYYTQIYACLSQVVSSFQLFRPKFFNYFLFLPRVLLLIPRISLFFFTICFWYRVFLELCIVTLIIKRFLAMNVNAHSCYRKSPQLDLTMAYSSSVHMYPAHSLHCFLVSLSNYPLCLQSGLEIFQPIFSLHLLFLSCVSSQINSADIVTLATSGEAYKVWSFYLCSFELFYFSHQNAREFDAIINTVLVNCLLIYFMVPTFISRFKESVMITKGDSESAGCGPYFEVILKIDSFIT
jgi:hypothetical protein